MCSASNHFMIFIGEDGPAVTKADDFFSVPETNSSRLFDTIDC